jgi:hypothetical protein
MEKKNHKLNKWVTFKGLKDNLGVPYLHLWIHLLQVHPSECQNSGLNYQRATTQRHELCIPWPVTSMNIPSMHWISIKDQE